MKLIIDIPEDELTEDEIEEAKRIADDCFSGVKTIIPDNATNGDVIKTMFPNGITIDRSTAYAKQVTEDWWNALYERR